MTKFPSKKDLDEVRKKLEKGLGARPLQDDADPVQRAKFALCEKFVIFMNENSLTQRELSKKVGVDEALISKIIHYHYDEFTTDRLIKYLSSIYEEVDVNVEVA